MSVNVRTVRNQRFYRTVDVTVQMISAHNVKVVCKHHGASVNVNVQILSVEFHQIVQDQEQVQAVTVHIVALGDARGMVYVCHYLTVEPDVGVQGDGKVNNIIIVFLKVKDKVHL